MGYMGLGMQKWIYAMRPRKPFSMDRKKSFTSVPKYNRAFKLQPSKKGSGISNLIIFIILSISIIFILNVKNDWLAHSSKTYRLINERIAQENQYAFDFLMISGESRLSDNNLLGAYSEFKLAYKIDSSSTRLKEKLNETLTLLCLEENLHCDELDKTY